MRFPFNFNFKTYFYLIFVFLLQTCASHKESASGSRIDSWEIQSYYLNRKVKIWTYLPPSYAYTQERLPVLYMHDGQNLFEDSLSYAGEWKVDESLDSLYYKTGKQLVVIGIENGGDKRIEELSPNSHPQYGGGQAASYLKFLKFELVPKAEQKYNIAQNPQLRGIMGSSLGGLISFYEAFQPHSPFRKFGVYSPSFWFDTNSFDWAKNQTIPKNSKMVLMIGEKEEQEHLRVIKMDSILKIHQRIVLKTEVYPEGEHKEWFWARSFRKDIEWLFFE